MFHFQRVHVVIARTRTAALKGLHRPVLVILYPHLPKFAAVSVISVFQTRRLKKLKNASA